MNTFFHNSREESKAQILFFWRSLSGRAFHCNLFSFGAPLHSAPKLKRISAAIANANRAQFNRNFQFATTMCFCIFVLFSASAQEQPVDSVKTNQLDEVLISAVRATSKTPVSFSNLSKEEIKTRNLGQDIPILLNFLPSVVTTSDAGNGVGYTGIRVRGSDATRVNVTINGIPYNDSESHGTFWVNMPDFASSVENLQLQRGVGTSTNGAGAFGASLNMLTDKYAEKATGEISNSFGSFNTRKHTVKFSSGLLNDHIEIAGRLSNIASDGYIDRAKSDLKSYFLQGTYVGKTTLIKALAFGGTEKTYQSWNGLEDLEKLENDRTYNVSGIFYDTNGNMRFYDNETDNYQQDHYQLHWNERISDYWNTNLAFHYTKGKGYYENYKYNEPVEEYPGILPTKNIDDGYGGTYLGTDLIRQKWLENDFYGTTFSANYKKEDLAVIFGGGWNKYIGDHFGKVIWARSVVGELGDRYYDDTARKTDGNVFAKVNYQISTKFNLFADMQYRRVSYNADGVQTEIVDDVFNFFNPKAGLTFSANTNNNFYLSYARANREPNRDDYQNGSPRPEQLDDFELGWRYESEKLRVNINGYYMKYKDQLVLTGALDDVGSPIRANSGDSYRIGLEFEAAAKILENLTFAPNFTVSNSRNKDFYFSRDGVLQNLGNTNIAFSPDFIAAGRLSYYPLENWQISLLSKFVGNQFMGNIDSEVSRLDSYFVSDVNTSYEFKPKTIFKSILISLLVNNIFDRKYESNGYFYTYDDGAKTYEGAGFYPQAGINILAGLTLIF